MKNADLHAVAGDYPPAAGTADALTYVITAGGSTVRFADPLQPQFEEKLRQLNPLLKVLDRTVSAGKRRIGRCPATASQPSRG